MQEFVDSLLKPAAIEGQENTARDARLLHLVLLGVIAFVILNSAGVLLIYKRKLAVSIILLAILAIAEGCFLLMRCGRVRLASAVLVFGLWCMAATHVALDGGLTGPSSFFLVAVCVFAALLLGSRGVLICAVLTVLSTMGMLIAGSVGHPMPQYFFVLPLPTFIVFTFTLLFVLVPLNLFLNELKRALGFAQKQLEERKAADAALHESEDRYRDLVEHSEDLICTHDLAGRILSVNEAPARILGYEPGELLNHNIRDLLAPEVREQFADYLATIRREGVANGSMLVLTKNGHKRIWAYHNTLREHGVSSPIVRGMAHDVTERKRAEEELRHLSGQLLCLQDEERRRIARELHDSTGQNLVALATILGQLRISTLSEEQKSRRLLSECKVLADRCIREVRTLSYLLHPPMLDEAGLEDAIRHYLDGFSRRSGIRLEVCSTIGRMERPVELALFRVVQESLTNIQRHSGSVEARIRIDCRPDQFHLEVSDQGREGTRCLAQSGENAPFEFGVGIPSMRERVKLIGGHLEIDSSAHGTTVRVTLPVRSHQHEKIAHSAG
jgi:PAS domain S-box-containing protein